MSTWLAFLSMGTTAQVATVGEHRDVRQLVTWGTGGGAAFAVAEGAEFRGLGGVEWAPATAGWMPWVGADLDGSVPVVGRLEVGIGAGASVHLAMAAPGSRAELGVPLTLGHGWLALQWRPTLQLPVGAERTGALDATRRAGVAVVPFDVRLAVRRPR